MQRRSIEPRKEWRHAVAAQGLTFHSLGSEPYWDESACWEFTAREIDRLERATLELHRICLAAGDYILERDLLSAMSIPESAHEAIRRSWREEPPALYGRMDLAYDGEQIKLLEYNADTPTSLVEAAVIQWRWLEDRFPQCDQFNSIHDKLVAKWKDLAPYLSQPVYFGHEESEEDILTVAYLRDTAEQAGLRTAAIPMQQIGWRGVDRRFVDSHREAIGSIFKLYPWEKLLADPFGSFALETMASGQHASPGKTQWLEPIWKMLWSNKALLAVLWEMYPGHELLLPAYFDTARGMKRFVRKPLFGREGANVTLIDGKREVKTDGPYAKGPWVYQAMASLACVDGNWAVLGSWLVDGAPCGLGVRESCTPIVRNQDRFLPHLFRPE